MVLDVSIACPVSNSAGPGQAMRTTFVYKSSDGPIITYAVPFFGELRFYFVELRCKSVSSTQ